MQVFKKSKASCCNQKRKRPVSNVPGKNTNMKTHILDLAKFLPQKTVFYLLLLAAFWRRHLYMHEMSIKFPFFKYPIQTISRLKFSFLIKDFFILD
jgi:hypothetical protein